MDSNTAIKLLQNNSSINTIFGDISNIYDISNWKVKYKEIALALHPDRCSHPEASNLMSKLNSLKSEIEDGVSFKDEAGTVTYWPNKVRIEYISASLANISYQNWKTLSLKNDSVSNNFKRYLPTNMTISDNVIEFDLYARAVPISRLQIPVSQEHTNWIMNRLFELATYFNSIHYVHAGFNLDSIFIIPENHGIICTSFLHMQYLDAKMRTVSGKFANFYPTKLFTDKIATHDIDFESIKRLGAYILGDTSCIGTKLITTHNSAFVNFIKMSHSHLTPFDVMDSFKKMIKSEFPTKFHILTI